MTGISSPLEGIRREIGALPAAALVAAAVFLVRLMVAAVMARHALR
jgi:hypothetical protein